MNRVEILIEDLCNEIDYWKNRAVESEKGTKGWKTKCFENLNDSIAHGKKMCNIMIKSLLSADEEKLKENFKDEVSQ